MIYVRAPETAHGGTRPAAAMVTPFSFPCGKDFYDFEARNGYYRSRCAPPEFSSYWWSRVGYYSPAICPRGYSAGCTRFDDEQGPTVEETETAMLCVPTGYTCNDNPSVASSGTARAVMIQIRWAEADLTSLETHPLASGVQPTMSIEVPFELRAIPKITHPPEPPKMYYSDEEIKELRRQAVSESDFFGTGIETGVPETSTSSRTRATTRPTYEPTDLPGQDTSGGGGRGVSGGAIAGIVIGVILGLGLVAGLVLFLWHHNRRKRRGVGQQMQPYSAQPYSGQTYSGMPELAHNPAGLEAAVTIPPPAALAAPPSKPGEKPVPATNLPEYELSTTRQESYPSELGSQPPLHSTIPEMQTYSPKPTHAEMAYNPPLHGTVPEMAHSASPTASSITHVQPMSPAEMAQPEMASLSSASGAPVWQPEPSAQELHQLREEHAQLEARRQTLMQLQQIEEQQAALRARIQAAEGRGEGAAGGGAGGSNV